MITLQLVSGLIFLHDSAAMPILCVPLYLPTVIENNFHAGGPWMTQSAGGLHNSFQPIIQMGSAIQTRSLPVPLLFSGSQAELSLAFVSHFRGQPDFFSVVIASLHKKERALPNTTPQQQYKLLWWEWWSSPLLLRNKSPWWNGSSTHRFDKVSQWLQPQIDYLTGLPDIACGPRHPSPWFRLHLLAQFEIRWGGPQGDA